VYIGEVGLVVSSHINFSGRSVGAQRRILREQATDSGWASKRDVGGGWGRKTDVQIW